METYTNKQSGFVNILIGIIAVVLLSVVAYIVVQNTGENVVVEEPIVVEEVSIDTQSEDEDDGDGISTKSETNPLYTEQSTAAENPLYKPAD